MAVSPAEFAAELVRRYALTGHDLVVQVGSGEGCLLQAVRDLGPRVLGIEPDGRATARAFRCGVDTLAAAFTPATADAVRQRYGPARLIVTKTAVGVPLEFVAAATRCLTPDGL